MSETASVTREELYAAIWSDSATVVARRYGVPFSTLARVCVALDVPRPGPGYWVRRRLGRLDERPPLPPVRPGQLLSWRPYESLDAQGFYASPRPVSGDAARERLRRSPKWQAYLARLEARGSVPVQPSADLSAAHQNAQPASPPEDQEPPIHRVITWREDTGEPREVWPRWMTIPTCALYIDSTERAVRSKVKRGQIPFNKAGGRVFFDRIVIDAWIGGPTYATGEGVRRAVLRWRDQQRRRGLSVPRWTGPSRLAPSSMPWPD